MELLVTIGICKVICSRLMILYTQYCLMGFFVCVSWLLVPFRRGWFHLQTSEMVLFVKITIAKVVFYWTMVLIAQFLPVNLLFFVSSMLSPSRYRYFQLVAGGSSSLQFVPARSSSVFILVCTVKKAHWSVFVIYCIPV